MPTADYVRFATAWRFRPDFCEAADPQSEGVVEHLVGYCKRDLIVPAPNWRGDLGVANAAAAAWCVEVNGRLHTEIQAVPAERLEIERPVLRPLPSLRPALPEAGQPRKVDKLCTVRFGSARYSVPHRLVGQQVLVLSADGRIVISTPGPAGKVVADHPLVGPGQTALTDAHYDKPARAPLRAVRATSPVEKEFLSLGEPAEAFLRAAAAAGTTRLAAHLAEILALVGAHGEAAVLAALARATTFRRFTAHDLRAIPGRRAARPDGHRTGRRPARRASRGQHSLAG